nr:GNAT family N-acetyltransferase [Acidobacteriota bacterium]
MSTVASFRWHTALDELPKDAWNALAEPLESPFLEWDWLVNLERSDCLNPEQGWQPCHLALSTEDGQLLAAAPLYVKGHSWGEFVFDQQWAEVSHRIGIPYYPKLVGMSPFTPAIGYRFLVRPELNERETCAAMMKAIDAFCKENQIAGCHFLHTDSEWCKTMETLGMKPWLHHSLIWKNNGFQEFEDYVAMFKSKQRNNIRRERRKAAEHLIFKAVPGEEAPDRLFGLMYDFYERTCRKFYNWSHYLNREFFAGLARKMPHRTLMIAAYERDGGSDPVAISFQVRKGG